MLAPVAGPVAGFEAGLGGLVMFPSPGRERFQVAFYSDRCCAILILEALAVEDLQQSLAQCLCHNDAVIVGDDDAYQLRQLA